MSLFRRKAIADLQAEAASEHGLKRALGPLNLTALGIGAIIGTGIFVLTGTVAAQNAGPAVVLSFVLAGVASIFAALCYSEFAALVPIAGSAYTYGYATLGELFAWIIGWDLVLEYALSATTVAIGWSGYVVSFLKDIGIVVPAHFAAARGTVIQMADGSMVTAWFNLPALIIVAAVTTLLVRGIKESANVNNVIVFIKVAVVINASHAPIDAAGTTASYGPEFLARFLAAQRARRDRIEARVRARLAELRSTPRAPRDEAFIVYRTHADPRCLDLALDANERRPGSVWGDARSVNDSANAMGRTTSLTAFLSQWSSASRAGGPENLARTTVPTLLLTYTADQSTFPSTRDAWLVAGGDRIRNVDIVGGDHYLVGRPDLQMRVADEIAAFAGTL